MKPTAIKQLQARSRNLEARVIGSNALVVTSRTNPALQHIVTLETAHDATIFARCTCRWAQNGGYACSHVMAALNQVANQKKRQISYWLSLDEAKRQRHKILKLSGGRDGDIYITSRSLSA